jgi:hypothetical protein
LIAPWDTEAFGNRMGELVRRGVSAPKKASAVPNKGCFPDLKSNIQVSVFSGRGHYVVSKPYLNFFGVGRKSESESGAGGKKSKKITRLRAREHRAYALQRGQVSQIPRRRLQTGVSGQSCEFSSPSETTSISLTAPAAAMPRQQRRRP